MVYDHEFTCPDGHTFKANAKIRARCPTCTKMAKRSLSSKPPNDPPSSVSVTDGSSAPDTTPSVTPNPEVSGVQLIRSGRPKVRIVAAKRPTPPKGKDGRFLPSKKSAVTRKTTTASKTASGIVKRHTVSAGTNKQPTMPKITKKPPRTAVARHVTNDTSKMSYTDRMISQYGRR